MQRFVMGVYKILLGILGIDIPEEIMTSEHCHEILPELFTGGALELLAHAGAFCGERLEHIQKVHIVNLQQKRVAVEEAVLEMTVALGPHVGTVLFDGVTSCRNFAGVPLVHFPADKEVRRYGIAFGERVAVAEPVIILGIPALREIEQIVDVVLDDIPGVGELLVHRFAHDIVLVAVVLAIANEPNLLRRICKNQLTVLVKMVDLLAVRLFFEVIHFRRKFIADQLVDHRLENVVVLAREQILAFETACAELGAPFEERLHDVVEAQELVRKVLVLDAAQLHQTAVPEQTPEIVHAHGRIEFRPRHPEAENLAYVVHRREIQHNQTVIQVEDLLLVHQLHIDGSLESSDGKMRKK